MTGCQGDAPDMNTPGDADSSWLAVGNATLLGGALLLLLLLLSWLRPRLPPPPNLKPPLALFVPCPSACVHNMCVAIDRQRALCVPALCVAGHTQRQEWLSALLVGPAEA
eukprot:SAG25_NODE_4551_length_792_cov_1.021645_1_plen_110_part_00